MRWRCLIGWLRCQPHFILYEQGIWRENLYLWILNPQCFRFFKNMLKPDKYGTTFSNQQLFCALSNLTTNFTLNVLCVSDRKRRTNTRISKKDLFTLFILLRFFQWRLILTDTKYVVIECSITITAIVCP